MTVADAIELLKTFPADALLIHTLYSDFRELEAADFSIMDGAKDYVEDPVHNGCMVVCIA